MSYDDASDEMIVKDCNGNVLQEGDAVFPIKDLKVKGSAITVKKGTPIRGIHLTNDPEEIECRVNGARGIILKTCFVKKA